MTVLAADEPAFEGMCHYNEFPSQAVWEKSTMLWLIYKSSAMGHSEAVVAASGDYKMEGANILCTQVKVSNQARLVGKRVCFEFAWLNADTTDAQRWIHDAQGRRSKVTGTVQRD